MPRTVDDILRDIEAFRPADGIWLPLDQLLAELWDAGVPARALPTLFRVFERFPEGDGAGVLWSIVHGVEGLGVHYEQPLRDSLARQPSYMGKTMLARLDRAEAGTTVADVEGPWVETEFESALIERCKRGWNTPIGELTNELLATYLRQKIALRLVVREARKRLAEGQVDGSELYDEELADALRSAAGET